MQHAIHQYIKRIEEDLTRGQATEHTHRPTLKALLEACGPNITAVNEPKRIACGAPDLVVLRNTLTVGYVEAKDVGRPLDEIAKSGQLKRYRQALNNLILTDYITFIWYVDGEEVDRARIATVSSSGKLTVRNQGVETLSSMLSQFLAKQPQDITSPQDLAERMAALTRLIRDIVIEAFQKNEASQMLTDLRLAMAQSLLPELDDPDQLDEFADMYAQTLAYGLFAARANFDGPGDFRRSIAAESIPRTNPFLRRLFTAITGPDINDEPYAGFVKDLVQLLNHIDLDEILAQFGKRTRQEDPVVHFYETFLAKYDPQLREARGVYYTPEPVVSYIVRSVDHILKTRFDLPGGLADESRITYTRTKSDGTEVTEEAPRVLILDPATGTATFLYYVVDLIREQFMTANNAGMWPGYVRQHLLPRLFGFELLMAPYAVAHLKLGLQLDGQDLPEPQRKFWRYDFQTDDRLGLYLTNTLEEAEKEIQTLYGPFRAISEEGRAAADVKWHKPIMVVLGNPPYSGHSVNTGEWVDGLLKGELPDGVKTQSYYEVDGKPLGERNTKWLQDDYVKFLRWGQWRIEQTGTGVLAFITNHGFLDNVTFRGMRRTLMNAFSDIYVLNLHGSSKKPERPPDDIVDDNVFDIQQGVAISFFIKDPHRSGPSKIYHCDLWGQRAHKYEWLLTHDIQSTEWTLLSPKEPLYLFIPQNVALRDEYDLGVSITTAMPVNVLGFQSHRDYFAIGFTRDEIRERIEALRASHISDQTVRERFGLRDSGSWQLSSARKELQADENWADHIIQCAYRPFDWRYCYYDGTVMDRTRTQLEAHVAGKKNLCLNIVRQTKMDAWHHAVVSDAPAPAVFVEIKDGSSVFPLYTYPESEAELSGQPQLFGTSTWNADDEGRVPNFSPEFIAAVEQKLGLTFASTNGETDAATFGPEDVFHYLYAVLNCPSYQIRYNEFLRVDFPRVPVTSDSGLFWRLVGFGAELVSLHLLESPRLSQATGITYPVPGDNEIVRRHPRYLPPDEPEPGIGDPLAEGRVYINADQYFGGIEPDVWEFQIGGYQVLDKWLKDRKGRQLTYDEIQHYQRIVVALRETMRLMEEIDEAIPEWPIE